MDSELVQPLGMVAHEAFRDVVRNQAIQIVAANLMLSTDGIEGQILGYLKTKDGFSPEGNLEAQKGFVSSLLDWANKERKAKFQGVRRSSLVSACSALEYAAKCMLVAKAETKPGDIESISSKRLSVTVDEYLSGSNRERFFVVADKLFQETTAKSHFEKFSKFIQTIASKDEHDSFESRTKEIVKSDFDEAFSVRNCIVHHGARSTKQLRRFGGYEIGQAIDISSKKQRGYLVAFGLVADAIADITAEIELGLADLVQL